MNFLIKKFSPIILLISFFLLIYTFYKSELVLNGDYRNYYKTYYLISLILIFFSIISFFLSNNIKQYLIISFLSSIVSLYFFEGYLTIKDHNSKNLLSEDQISKDQISKEQIFEKQTGKRWDKRKKLEIYNEMKRNDKKIVVVVSPGSHLDKNNNTIIPLSGISNSNTIYCNENGYYSIYQSDRYGFNNPDKEWDKKKIEYLLVGDSFAHGACVNRPNDITSILRSLTKKSALNLGYGGNGPLIEYATLREYLNSNVKKVLWLYFEGNDFTNLDKEMNDKILINYYNDLFFTQNLKLKQNEIDDLGLDIIKNREKEKRKSKKKFKFELFKYIKITNTRILIFPKPVSGPTPTTEFKKILKLAKNFTTKNNSKLYFIYLPQYYRYNSVKPNNTNYYLVKKIIEELNIPFIDINKEVFEKEQDPLKLFPFKKNGHYTVEGYKKIAETIYKFTKD